MYDGRVLLCLAAFEPEMRALDASLPREIVGIGLVEAALGAARAINAHRTVWGPTEVVLLGTAGAYPGSGLEIGDVVVGREVVLAAASGALVEAMPRKIATDASLSACFAARRVVVATTLAITIDDAAARLLAESTGAEVEHLEAFAVARACAAAGVAFTTVLGIANAVGATGRAQWRENHERAAAAACAAIRNPRAAQSLG